VEGICPSCNSNQARGDQCDSCNQLYNAIELKEPYCIICKSSPVIKESDHVFMKLDEIQHLVEKWSKNAMKEGVWSNNCKSLTLAKLKEGLKPRCISRDLKWGVNVPENILENKVFYVWFDAPIGYISITANFIKSDDWRKWWQNPEIKY